MAFDSVSTKKAEVLARKILDDIVKPINIRKSNIEYSIGASIGLTLSTNQILNIPLVQALV